MPQRPSTVMPNFENSFSRNPNERGLIDLQQQNRTITQEKSSPLVTLSRSPPQARHPSHDRHTAEPKCIPHKRTSVETRQVQNAFKRKSRERQSQDRAATSQERHDSTYIRSQEPRSRDGHSREPRSRDRQDEKNGEDHKRGNYSPRLARVTNRENANLKNQKEEVSEIIHRLRGFSPSKVKSNLTATYLANNENLKLTITSLERERDEQ